tara:strand:+ start:3518 stop:6589 length:3072 start_codon:yes stop_codon:yes gene_type:complete
MEQPKGILKEYDSYCRKYHDIYGDKTAILIQAGAFYEFYAVIQDNYYIGEKFIYDICQNILGIAVTVKNKKKDNKNTIHNYLQAGFQMDYSDKFVTQLLNHGYTIVLIQQITEPPNIERKVTEILSPGTTLKNYNKKDENFFMSIYIENINSKIFSSLSTIDLSTGKSFIHEIKPSNDCYWIDEIGRLISYYNPSEIIFHSQDFTIDEDFITNQWDLSHQTIQINHYKEGIFKKISYQNELFQKIFTIDSILSPIDFLDLERVNLGRISYIYLLQYVYEHSENILRYIEKPSVIEENKHLLLTSSSVRQLNVINNYSYFKGKNESLFSVCNNCNTSMGRRLLKERLLYPEINSEIIENRYNQIETLRKDKNYEHFTDYLSKIADLEKYNRLMSLDLLKSNDFYLCYLSYDFIQLLISKVEEFPEIWEQYKIYHEDIFKWKDYYIEINKIFEWDNFGKYTLMNEKSLFKKDYSNEMDEITDKIETIQYKYKLICERFSKILHTDNSVKLDFNENFNWFLYTTNKRANTFKERLINIGDKYIHIIKGNTTYFSFNKEDFSYKKKDNSNTIIHFDISQNLSTELVSLQKKLVNLNKKLWKNIMIDIYQKYKDIFHKMNSFLSELDVSISNAKLSIENAYCRPEIVTSDKSFLKAHDIRHPIVERINTDTEYITNDITLGIENKDGILLYGTNACGKSTLMKSIGLNIIMAQAGLYTSCSQFQYYPYEQIFTRILNNDNIFKSQSTFAVEVQELKHIFNKSNENSLILGDELCSGTETVSAISIVSASIQTFSKNKCSFMITSHLHQLTELQKIRGISNLSIYHLKIDVQDNVLIYNRKLSHGAGPSIYGLKVCEAMGISNEFMKLCNEAKNDICNESKYILNTKTSTYNSDIILDKCKICNNNAEETHHIKPQEDADENNIIENFHKNKKHNLIGLCKKCHADVTYNRLEIKGYIQTSDGIKLDYHTLKPEETKKTKKKFNDEQINTILKYKNKGMKNTNIISILQLKHDIKISTSTLKKIFTDSY